MKHNSFYPVLVLPLFHMNINMQKFIFFFSIASMSCGPLTSETDSVSIKNIIIKKIMVKKFSNAQEVNIFSSSNVSSYAILSRVLDSDPEILKVIFFFFFFFSKISPVVTIARVIFHIFFQTPLVLLSCQRRAPLLQKILGETLCSKNDFFLSCSRNRTK